MSDLEVQALRLPGIGWRYTLPADGGRQVVVVTEDAGPTHLVFVDAQLEEPLATVRLPTEHTAVLAALLIRARFSTREDLDDSGQPTRTCEGVAVEAVRIGIGSPLVGLAPGQAAHHIGSDVALLGVISDATPELMESDQTRPLTVGDRLVLVGNRSRLSGLQNTGPPTTPQA